MNVMLYFCHINSYNSSPNFRKKIDSIEYIWHLNLHVGDGATLVCALERRQGEGYVC